MRAWSCVVVVAALSLSACGDDDGGGTSVDSVTLEVGPSGGTVELPGGGKVTIPANALSRMEMIKITKLDVNDVAALPSNMEPAGKPFAFEPHGLTFAQDVKVEVEYEGADMDVRPMKLPNEMADTSEWTTVFPSEKDMTMKRVSFDTRSFSVILAARPRRNSGVVTLPDGAIVEDAGMSDGAVAGTGGGGTGGSDAGGMGGSGGTDAGMDAAIADSGVGACDAVASQLSAVASVEVVTNNDGVYVSSGGGLLTAYSATGTSLTEIGPIVTLDSGEYFNDGSIAAAGSVVVAASSRGGVQTTGRVYITATSDLSGDAGSNTQSYDFAAYSAYWTAFNPGPPNAFNPYGRHVATDGADLVVVEEATYGNLVLFSAGTAMPLGYLGTMDLNTAPLSGVVGMVIHQGFLVAAINRLGGIGVDPFNGIRTFDLRDPGNITMVDEVVRTGTGADSLAYDESNNRYYLSLGTQAQIALFTVDDQGGINPEVIVANTRAGAQARSITIVGGQLLAVGTPNLGSQPVDVAIDLFSVLGDTLTPVGTVDLPDSPAGDYGNALAQAGVIYSAGGPALNVIDVTACLTD